MIYLFDEIDSFSTADLEAAYRQISPQRYAYALKYHFEIDRKLCVLAYLLLLEGLKREYAIRETPEFAYTPGGKPYLLKYPNIHFSLSHCNKAVVCAISNQPIGIDVEEIRPDIVTEEMLQAVCNQQESDLILASTSPAKAFTSLWTRKESYLKMSDGCPATNLPTLFAPFTPSSSSPASPSSSCSPASCSPASKSAPLFTTFSPAPTIYLCTVCHPLSIR